MSEISKRNRLYTFKLMNLEVDQWTAFKRILAHYNNDLEKTHKALIALRKKKNKITI